METQNEFRSLPQDQAEVRMDPDGKIVGNAMVFNTRSKLLFGEFYEVIKPEAVEGILDRSDILGVLDHNQDRGILGRNEYGKGTMKVEIARDSLRFVMDPPDTPLAYEVRQYIQRKEIKGASFQFHWDVRDEWKDLGNNVWERTITYFRELFDISVVFRPAYPATSVAVRSLQEHKESRVMDPQLAAYYAEKRREIDELKTNIK